MLSAIWPQAPYNETTRCAARAAHRRVVGVSTAVFLATLLYAFGFDVLAALTGAVSWKAIAILVLDAVLRAELFITGHGIHVATMLALGVLTMAQYMRAGVVLYGLHEDNARGVWRADAGEIAIRLIRSAANTTFLFILAALAFLVLTILAVVPKIIGGVEPSFSSTVASVAVFAGVLILPSLGVSRLLLPAPSKAVSDEALATIRKTKGFRDIQGLTDLIVVLARGLIQEPAQFKELERVQPIFLAVS